MRELVACKYRVFLSCSDRDRTWATWLQQSIESYRVDRELVGRPTPFGAVPASLRPVLRDGDDAALGPSARAALEASCFLLVLCSPHSARRPAVDEAICHFVRLGRIDRVIPVMVAGGDGDGLPPSLRLNLGDFRPIVVRPLSGSKARAVHKVVARLTGIDADELHFRHVRAQQRRTQWRRGVAAALVLSALAGEVGRRALPVVLGGGGLGVASMWMRAGATADPERAARQRQLALALERRGDALRAQGDLAGALDHYRTERSILVAAAPSSDWQYDLGAVHARIGFVQEALGDFGAALQSYEACREVGARFVAARPDDAGWRRDLAVSHDKLAAMHHRLGHAAMALAEWRKGRDLLAALVEEEPESELWAADLAQVEEKIAALEGRGMRRAGTCAVDCVTLAAGLGDPAAPSTSR